MECNSEVESLSQNDSLSSTASITRYREETISLEEKSLLQLLQRGISETTEENLVFTKEISTVLAKLSLEPRQLSNDIKEGLHKVSLILRSEKLSDLDETAMSIVRERKKVEEKKRQREERKLALMHDDIFRKYITFGRKLEYLQEAVNFLEESIENLQKDQENAYCDQVLLSIKVNEYQQTLEKLESDLIQMQIEELYPKKILAKYERYLEMSGELVELNRHLTQYGDLPPNLLQAKALLEAKQKEYETLEQEFLAKTNCP